MFNQKDLLTSDSGDIVILESKTEYDQFKQEVEKFKKQVKDLEQNNLQLKSNLNKRDRDYQQLIEDLEKFKKIEEEKIIYSESSSIKLLKQFKILETQIQEQQQIIIKLKEENQILLENNKELENQKDYLQSQNSVIDQEKEKIFNSYFSRKQELQEVAQEKNKFEEELKMYKQQIEMLEGKIDALQQKEIDQEQQISYWKQFSVEKEQLVLKFQEEIKSIQKYKADVIDQPNKDEFKKNIEESLKKISQEIQGRFQYIEKELKDNESQKENKRMEEVTYLNKTFNLKLRRELENYDINFKHEFRDNQVRE